MRFTYNQKILGTQLTVTRLNRAISGVVFGIWGRRGVLQYAYGSRNRNKRNEIPRRIGTAARRKSEPRKARIRNARTSTNDGPKLFRYKFGNSGRVDAKCSQDLYSTVRRQWLCNRHRVVVLHVLNFDIDLFVTQFLTETTWETDWAHSWKRCKSWRIIWPEL